MNGAVTLARLTLEKAPVPVAPSPAALIKSEGAARLLRYDAAADAWHWHLESGQDLSVAENVVDLMTVLLRSLSERSQQAVRVAACIGKQRPAMLTQAELQAAFDNLAGPTGLTERASTFRRSDVVEALASRFGASCAAIEIEAQVGLANPERGFGVVLAADQGRSAFTHEHHHGCCSPSAS